MLLTSTANIEILLQGFNKCTCIRGDGSCLEFCVTENYPVVLGILPACIVVLKQVRKTSTMAVNRPEVDE